MEKTISKISQWLEGVFFFWFFQFPKDVLNNLFLSLSLPPHLLLSQTKDFSLSLSLSLFLYFSPSIPTRLEQGRILLRHLTFLQ